VLADLGRQEEALAGYRRALELDQDDADAHYNLADLLEEMGCKADAQDHWQAYVQRDPHSEWGRHCTGEAITREGEAELGRITSFATGPTPPFALDFAALGFFRVPCTLLAEGGYGGPTAVNCPDAASDLIACFKKQA
jgi:tetratricopeptide (TPR) repeat protein